MCNYPQNNRSGNESELQWLEDSVHILVWVGLTAISTLFCCLLSFLTCGDLGQRR